MLSTRNAVAAICVVALVACDRAADPITGPDISGDLISGETEFLPGIPVLDPFSPQQADGDGVIESARGGGHITVDGELRTFAFTAKNKADLIAQGQFQLNNRAQNAREHGMVTCLEVDGNTAFIGAIVTHSNVGTEGQARLWQVVDNGEGFNDPPDEISLEIEPEPPLADQLCHSRPQQPLRDVESGNIQVRDATDPGVPL